jgi:predicted metal-dependent phosphotriesterase family hydrolase
MERRDFIALLCAVPAVVGNNSLISVPEQEHYVMTVKGKVHISKLGSSLPHEHFITDFAGAKSVAHAQYTVEQAQAVLLPHLQAIKELGIQSIFECSPSYIGKNVRLLKNLSILSGLHIITNTGYYAAVGQKYLPDHAFTESESQLSDRWISEYTKGMDGSDIKPGFIKLGTDNGPLKNIEIKLIRAAGITHLKTGLKIAIHTGNAEAAIEELKTLEEIGIKSSAFIWVHAQNDHSGDTQIRLARRGCWISLDGLNSTESSVNKYEKDIMKFKAAGLLSRLLISQDDGFAATSKDGQTRFEPYQNGNTIPYITLFTKLKPRLLLNGLTREEFDLITVTNPALAFRLDR